MENFEEVRDEILTFWFGDIRQGCAGENKKKLWYQPSAADDAAIRDKFEQYWQRAVEGELDALQGSPKGCLAFIIVTDQFSRHMFRGRAKAYASDFLALRACLSGLEKKFDQQLELVEQLFFYHPLEHSESLAHQQLCLSLLSNRLKGASDKEKPMLKTALKFAREHHDIIAEFSRFPHRNRALERQNTAAESFYLAQGAKTFGQ